MPQQPSALGALKQRPYRPRPVAAPQDITDVDALLADTKDFLGELPDGTGTPERMAHLNELLADMDADELRSDALVRENAARPKIGAFGAVAKSAAVPIRVLSQFGGPASGFAGEGIAQGLDSLAMLDGAPVPQGTTGGDVTKALGKAATATAFGRLNTAVGPLSALAKRTGKSLAGRLGFGAAAGAAEGAALNVTQGALTRGFDEGSVDAALDPDGLKLDATLGAGLGAAGGAAVGALDALAARGARPTKAPINGPVSNWPRQAPEAPWQRASEDAWARNQATPGNVRGPAPRQRVPPPGLTGYGNVAPTGPEPQKLLGPATSTILPPPLQPEVGTQAVRPSVEGSPRFDVLEPSTYQGPENPTAAPRGTIDPTFLDYPPTADEIAAAGAANPLPEVFPAPTGPELPRGRFPADSPTAQAAQPLNPPPAYPTIAEMRRIAMLDTPPTLDELNAVTFREMADPSADVSMQAQPLGPPTVPPFDMPVPPEMARAMSNPMFGTPARVTYDGQGVQVHYRERPGQPMRMALPQFQQMFPELKVPGATQAMGPERLTITPKPEVAERAAVAASNQRALESIPDDPLVDGELARLLGEMEEVSPGVIAEPGTTFAPDPTPPLAVAADETAPFTDDQLEALLRQADEQDAAAAPQQPEVELLDPDAATIQNNASGESGASTEAINRQRSLAAQGQTRVMLDRAGRETPVLGADGVDVKPQRGQTHAIRNADGSYTIVDDNGGKVPTRAAAPPPPAAPERDAIEEVFDLSGDEVVNPTPAGPTRNPDYKVGDKVFLAGSRTPGVIEGVFPHPDGSPRYRVRTGAMRDEDVFSALSGDQLSMDPVRATYDRNANRIPDVEAEDVPTGRTIAQQATEDIATGRRLADSVEAAVPDSGSVNQIALNDGDQPGTFNQAGKFVPIEDDSWRTLEPAKNKSVAIRRADGTVEVVRDNGGKVPKTWSAEKWTIKQEQARLKAEAKAAREAERAAKKQTPPLTEQAAAGESVTPPQTAPEPSASPEAAPAAAAPPREAPEVRSLEKTKFGDRDAVEVSFGTRPPDDVRKALAEYGFRYFARSQKWAFNIPRGSKLTPDEVESAVQSILRGESVEAVQPKINADAGSQKAAAALGGDFPPAGTGELLDRGLDEAQRARLRDLGWTKATVDGRRKWTAPGQGMRGDMELRPAPEVPPATPENPPVAEARSTPSADAISPTSSDAGSRTATSSSPESGTATTPQTTSERASSAVGSDASPATQTKGSNDYEKVDPATIKIDSKAYQFKGGTDSRGRSEKLKGVEEWDPEQAILSPVLLHRRTDGSLYVVDGHQRVGLAQDLKAQGKDVPDLNARVLEEANGITVERARRMGAMSNVMHNTADPLDIARVLREGELSPLEQKRIGRIQKDAGEKFRQGRDLAKLSDQAFDYFRDSAIDPRFARMVSQYRPELHESLLQQLDRQKPRTNTEAEAILSHAAELKSGGVQVDMFGNATVDDSFRELVQFKERVLGTFRTNRRLFGKARGAADALESAGETRIDRDAAGKIASDSGRAEELWSKFSNAQGSYTRTAIQEAFSDYKAGRTSFGKATERIAEALDADYTGKPASGSGGRADAGPDPSGFDEGTGLFGDADGPGSLFDAGAVAEGRSSGAFDDAADGILDAARKLLKDERGELNVGDGLAGLEQLLKKHPRAFDRAVRMAGGAFLGSLTHDDEDASILDNLVFGAALGASTRFASPAWRQLSRRAPGVAKYVREALTGKYVSGAKPPRTLQVRRPPGTEDISGFAKWFWSPDKVVPDVWAHIEPIMKSLYELEAPARKLSPDQIALARKSQISEAMSFMRGEVSRAKDAGHARRAAYVQELIEELAGEPTIPEALLNDITNGRVKPKDTRRVMALATNAIYHKLLGWNVASGLANATQSLLNYPQLGAKATVKGILTAYSKQGRQELRFLNLNRRPMGQTEERLLHRWAEKYLDWSQTPMRWSDSGNRRATYAGAMDRAKALGFSETQAKGFANELVGQTQGIAGDLGSNPFHRHFGPLRAFTKYPLIWASLVEDMATHPDPAVKRRFYGMMTGMFAASAIGGIQLSNYFIPRAGMVPGVGASIDVFQHLFGAPDHDFEEHFEPGGTEDVTMPGYPVKAVQTADRFARHGAQNRPILGRKGQVLREVSALEDLGSLLGVETTARSNTREAESDMYEFATEAKRQEGIRSRRARRAAGEAIERNDRKGSRRALDALSERSRSNFLKDRTRTPKDRARRLVPLRRREEFDERFGKER